MKREDFLRSLPPELAAKMQIDEQDENLRHTTEAFTNALVNVQEAMLTIGTIAWEEAATSAEKEDAVRATAVVMTFSQQVSAVLTLVLPPKVRQPILGAILGGMSKEVMRYDGWLRQNLPAAAKTRADHLAAEREQSAGGES